MSWLLEDYGFDEVVAELVDVGQVFDKDASIARGEAAGAEDVILLDRREAFASDQADRTVGGQDWAAASDAVAIYPVPTRKGASLLSTCRPIFPTAGGADAQ